VRAPALILVLAALPGAALGAPAEKDDDFEPDVPPRSLALGPVPRGGGALSLDLGWIRSGLRFDIGLGARLDLVLRGDTMLLYDGFSGQHSILGGLRFTPVADGSFRLSIEGYGGLLLVPAARAQENVTAVGGEANLGVVFSLATVYGRVGLRGLSSDVASETRWSRQAELGGGVERTIGRFVLGAEWFAWARPRHAALSQWRLRAGYTF
jgi:hypothetical protein